jgi:hypothetical protein
MTIHLANRLVLLAFRRRFVQGDVVGGGRDGAQTNRRRNANSTINDARRTGQLLRRSEE